MSVEDAMRYAASHPPPAPPESGGRIRVRWIGWGLWQDLDCSWRWSWPKFGLTRYKGKPCPTRWLYDWILYLGVVAIFKPTGEGQ